MIYIIFCILCIVIMCITYRDDKCFISLVFLIMAVKFFFCFLSLIGQLKAE